MRKKMRRRKRDPPLTLPVREGVVTLEECDMLNFIVAIIEDNSFFEIVFYLLDNIIDII